MHAVMLPVGPRIATNHRLNLASSSSSASAQTVDAETSSPCTSAAVDDDNGPYHHHLLRHRIGRPPPHRSRIVTSKGRLLRCGGQGVWNGFELPRCWSAETAAGAAAAAAASGGRVDSCSSCKSADISGDGMNASKLAGLRRPVVIIVQREETGRYLFLVKLLRDIHNAKIVKLIVC